MHGILLGKVSAVLKEAARKHFKEYLRFQEKRIIIKRNPLDFEADKRSAAFRKIQTAQKHFIEHLRSGHAPDDSGQMNLWQGTDDA